ncbi:MAG: 50S ribosomal protein L23 [Candidatus Paceibacterota bacterium]|jgi:large subunit ribosomal protein L23
MAIFSKKDKKEVKAVEAKADKPAKKVAAKKAVAVKAPVAKKEVAVKAAKGDKVVVAKNSVLRGPRVTEKASVLHEKNNVYTFNVAVSANTQQIAHAIRAAYKVTPLKVSVVSIPAKAMFARGRKGKTVGAKKAYVYLKKGDVIEFA